ncbi:probable inactive receptor kinase At2g26730 [Argentina anserina]|uniref:probable inactive receptor kinase At2g26730 n=1 Tax=Argentina anserina TaxID=57926 RepID=UPI00217625E8|nr:probable inactive receptor kinase At2g26730 [Potentilla anserina]
MKRNANQRAIVHNTQLVHRKMSRIPFWELFIVIFLIFRVANSEENEVKQALVQFMQKLSPENATRDGQWGWNMSTDPCTSNWTGVECNKKGLVRKIKLEKANLTGVLDASSLRVTKTLVVLSLKDNNITGLLSEDIALCKDLTHLYLSGNHFSGVLPESLSQLSNLKRFDISNNNFNGELPDMQKISGLLSFLVQNNQLEGSIPEFDFSNLKEFNVSNNLFSGPIPDVKGHFNASSFAGDPNLCGEPLTTSCPPVPMKSKKSSSQKVLIFSGYVILGLVVVLFLVYKFFNRGKSCEEKKQNPNKEAESLETPSSIPSTTTTSNYKAGGGNQTSEFSLTSVESGIAAPLVVFTSPLLMGLTFEQLLRAPADLLGKGKNGSLYKVLLDGGVNLVVKRIRNCGMSSDDFKTRMMKIDRVKCHNVLPTIAFYCSRQEKLLVYEYQPNGNLFNLLHRSPKGQIFDWGSRLNVADSIAEALAFMHGELNEDGIAHGNLKSMNILFNMAMEPCISEYGIMMAETQEQSVFSSNNEIRNDNATKGHPYGTFNGDVYAFGVILLELLTGKMVQKNGFDLPSWVNSMIKEEWTVEVFDRALILEGSSEERMVSLLQVALKCINSSPTDRPAMDQVSLMIKSIKEDEESSVTFDP